MGGWIGSSVGERQKRKPRKQTKDRWPTRTERPIGKIDLSTLPRSEYTPHPPEQQEAKQDA